jgi:hypothetical protein
MTGKAAATYLFIGGTADGRRYNTGGDPTYYIPIPVQESLRPPVEPQNIPCQFPVDRYVRLQIALAGQYIAVYVHEWLTDDQALLKLLEGYRPQEGAGE